MKKVLRTIKQSLFIGLLCLFSLHSQALELKSTVDRTSMNLNELLRLVVTIDKQGSGNIDFSALDLQFTIIRSQKNSKASFVNGKLDTQTQWTLLLSPKETGELIIPSFTIDGVYSDAIAITVNKGKNNQNSNNQNNSNNPHNNAAKTSEDVFLIASVNKNTVYVQEQLLLTLRLYYRVSLSGYTPTELIIDGIKPTLVAETNSKENFNGQRYNILEKVYSIHPQSSGDIIIPEQTWQVERAYSSFNNNHFNDPYLSLNSQAHTITVKPVPTASTAKHWLPTSQLSASQQWEQSIISAKVGEPLNFSIVIDAQGLSHSQLPTIELKSNEQFTIYTDQAKTKDQKSRNGIAGNRTQQYAVIPKTTGVFIFPSTTIKWWNTLKDQEETITLEEKKIIVGNGDVDSSNSSPIPLNDESNNTLHTSSNNSKEQPLTLLLWQLLSALFFCLSLVLLWLWINARRKLSILRHNTNNNNSQQQTLQAKHNFTSLYQKIEQAAEKKEWIILRKLLLQWASLSLGQTIKNTDEIIQNYPHLQKDLQNALELLDKQLYSESHVLVWDFKELVSLLKQQQQLKNKLAAKQEQQTSQLPPLYHA